MNNEERFDGIKGLGIFFRSWRPSGKPRAVVAICHGLNAHSGEYLWVGDQLQEAGFAVYALDLRGRGKSDGDRFYVDDLADYVSDVAMLIELAKSANQACPSTCSATAQAVSSRASTRWTIRTRSRG